MKRFSANAVTGVFLFVLGAVAFCHGSTPDSITIALIGDSTVTDKAGWGKAFADRFKSGVVVLNFSAGGRSAKSWYDENRLPVVLKEKPDYVLIQFGHNGQPGKGPHRETDPATSYRDYLKLYVAEFRKIGTKPIIVSPVTRRRFDEKGRITSTLTPWARAARIVAGEVRVPFVDLHSASIDYHNKAGLDESMTFNPREGDRTHFNRKGAEVISGLIWKEIQAVAPGVYQYIRSD